MISHTVKCMMSFSTCSSSFERKLKGNIHRTGQNLFSPHRLLTLNQHSSNMEDCHKHDAWPVKHAQNICQHLHEFFFLSDRSTMQSSDEELTSLTCDWWHEHQPAGKTASSCPGWSTAPPAVWTWQNVPPRCLNSCSRRLLRSPPQTSPGEERWENGSERSWKTGQLSLLVTFLEAVVPLYKNMTNWGGCLPKTPVFTMPGNDPTLQANTCNAGNNIYAITVLEKRHCHPSSSSKLWIPQSYTETDGSDKFLMQWFSTCRLFIEMRLNIFTCCTPTLTNYVKN